MRPISELDKLGRHHAEQAKAAVVSVRPMTVGDGVEPGGARRWLHPAWAAVLGFVLVVVALAPFALRTSRDSTRTDIAGISTVPNTVAGSSQERLPINEGSLFKPEFRSEGSLVVVPLTFLDGSSVELVLPPSLANRIGGFTPAAEVGWDVGTCCGRSLDVVYGTIDKLFAQHEPLAVYRDARDREVPYFAVEGDLNYMAFQFGSWVVLAWDRPGSSAEGFTDEERARFAALLDGYETADGFLVLEPSEPMVSRQTDSPDGRLDETSIGDHLVGVLINRRCPDGSPVTAQGYTITEHEPQRISVCSPEHSTELHITGITLTIRELDQIEIRKPSAP